jgi:hypothetical protein
MSADSVIGDLTPNHALLRERLSPFGSREWRTPIPRLFLNQAITHVQHGDNAVFSAVSVHCIAFNNPNVTTADDGNQWKTKGNRRSYDGPLIPTNGLNVSRR